MTMLDGAEVALVAAILDTEPAVTGVVLCADEYSPVPKWDPVAVVCLRGARQALELEERDVAAFATTHPPVAQYEIGIDDDMRAAVERSRTDLPRAS
ncbi:hypothetical protein ACWFRB_08880 [Rhodococcus sp. NPDC055112]